MNRARVPHGSTGRAEKAVISVCRFVKPPGTSASVSDPSQWSIHAQDGPRFTAERRRQDNQPHRRPPLPGRGLLDRLDGVEKQADDPGCLARRHAAEAPSSSRWNQRQILSPTSSPPPGTPGPAPAGGTGATDHPEHHRRQLPASPSLTAAVPQWHFQTLTSRATDQDTLAATSSTSSARPTPSTKHPCSPPAGHTRSKAQSAGACRTGASEWPCGQRRPGIVRGHHSYKDHPAQPGPGSAPCSSPTTATWTGRSVYRAAFHGDVAELADIMAPVLTPVLAPGCEARPIRVRLTAAHRSRRKGAGRRLQKCRHYLRSPFRPAHRPGTVDVMPCRLSSHPAPPWPDAGPTPERSAHRPGHHRADAVRRPYGASYDVLAAALTCGRPAPGDRGPLAARRVAETGTRPPARLVLAHRRPG